MERKKIRPTKHNLLHKPRTHAHTHGHPNNNNKTNSTMEGYANRRNYRMWNWGALEWSGRVAIKEHPKSEKKKNSKRKKLNLTYDDGRRSIFQLISLQSLPFFLTAIRWMASMEATPLWYRLSHLFNPNAAHERLQKWKWKIFTKKRSRFGRKTVESNSPALQISDDLESPKSLMLISISK